MKRYILAGVLFISTSCFSQIRVDTVPRQRISGALLHWILTNSNKYTGWCELSNAMMGFQDSLRRDSIRVDSTSRNPLRAIQGSFHCLYYEPDSLRKDSLRRAKYAPYHKQT